MKILSKIFSRNLLNVEMCFRYEVATIFAIDQTFGAGFPLTLSRILVNVIINLFILLFILLDAHVLLSRGSLFSITK